MEYGNWDTELIHRFFLKKRSIHGVESSGNALALKTERFSASSQGINLLTSTELNPEVRLSPILSAEPPNAQKCCAEKGERECIGSIRRTEVGVVWNGLSLQVCVFVLLGSARKNDMPCYFVSSGQPKPMMGNHIFAHFFGIERHICITFLCHISLV